MKPLTQLSTSLFCFSLFLVYVSAQTETNEQYDQETVDGCLYSSPGSFNLIDEKGFGYALKGHESELKEHSGEEVKVVGTVRGDRDQNPTLIVHSVEKVFNATLPQLAASIANASNWHEHKNGDYGITYALPEFPSDTAVVGGLAANFVSEEGTTTFASLNIPREIYPDTNFVGGSVLFSVSPRLTNRESCEKFGTSDTRFVSSVTIDDIPYVLATAGDVGLGTYYESYSYHTFQNGYCYELAFQFGGYNTSNQDLGCRVPIVGDYKPVIDAFMRRVRYSKPAHARATPNPTGVPKINSLIASSHVVDDTNPRGTITFTWSSNADYVTFSYLCSVTGRGIVILEQGASGGRNCANDPKPITPNPEVTNHPSSSSIEVSFGNFHHEEPISITVIVTPFSHGRAFAISQKSVTISVAPFHPRAPIIPKPQ